MEAKKLSAISLKAHFLYAVLGGLKKFNLMFILLFLFMIHGCESVALHTLGLTEFPPQEDLPAADTSLNLNHNKLTFVPEGALCHMTALIDLRIQNNLLQSVGNLSCVGESLLYLFLSGNGLTSIPDNAFQGLVTLERLYLYDNDLTAVPDNAFQGLVKLQQLYINSNELTAVPSMQHVASTLQILNIDANPLSGNLATSEMATLTSLTELSIKAIGLKGYPSLPELPELLLLQFGSEDLELGIGDVFDLSPFPKLKTLRMIGSKLTRIPTIDATQQLNEMRLDSNNQLVLTGADDFKRFPKTTTLFMNNCGLSSFPDFTHIGQVLRNLHFENNRIEVISKELLSKVPKLTNLNLKNTDLVTVPCVFGTALNTLNLHGTPVTEIPCVPSSLRSLVLDHSDLQRVDIRHAVSLRALTQLFVRNVPELEEVHDYMDLAQKNVLTFQNSPNLDICKCQHAWMKIAQERGSPVYVTDKACGVSGELWTELNSTRFLEVCDDSSLQVQDASSETVWSVHRPNAASCDLPAHAYYSNIRQVQCGRHCLSLAGCTSYKFLGTKKLAGHCQVLVPSMPANPVTVLDAEDAGWECYTALPGNLQKIIN